MCIRDRLALYIRAQVKESEAWEQHRAPTVGAILRTASGHWKIFLYLVLMMTLMMFFSHGTQDLYPDFLKTTRGLSLPAVSNLVMLLNVGAVVGAITFGHLSERFGRRRSMIAAMMLSLLVLPIWAFIGDLTLLAFSAFLMQVGVQGAWGIIPAHLNELSPDETRGLMPGFAYQLGILFAAPVNNIVYALRGWIGYSWALAAFQITNIFLLVIVLLLGRENKGRNFSSL